MVLDSLNTFQGGGSGHRRETNRTAVQTCYSVSMAKSCPSCSRPNADAATKCLYCSEPLDPPPLEPDVDSDESPLAPLTDAAWHLVILIPGGAPEEGMVEGLADAAGVSRYDARLSLTSMRPRVFRRVEGEFFARGLSQQLTASRIPHYVVSQKSIEALPVSRAQKAELKERHLEASLDGRMLSIPYQEILLLVRGEITRENHNDKTMATAKGANRSLSPGLLLHLYSRDASVAVEIDPESFAWPGSGHEPTRSALLNVERFVDAIEDKAPGVIVDRAFDLELPVLSRAGGDTDLSHVFSTTGTSDGVLYHNEDQFRFYARWRYRLERHLKKPEKA